MTCRPVLVLGLINGCVNETSLNHGEAVQTRAHPPARAEELPGGRLRRRGPDHQEQRYLTETAPTHAEAEKALTRLLARVDQQRSPATGATVATLIARWLEAADLELSTRDGYEGYIRRNILPALGDLPLRRLDAETLDRFYAHLRAHGGRCPRCWDRARRALLHCAPASATSQS
jgi:integrase